MAFDVLADGFAARKVSTMVASFGRSEFIVSWCFLNFALFEICDDCAALLGSDESLCIEEGSSSSLKSEVAIGLNMGQARVQSTRKKCTRAARVQSNSNL